MEDKQRLTITVRPELNLQLDEDDCMWIFNTTKACEWISISDLQTIDDLIVSLQILKAEKEKRSTGCQIKEMWV